MSEWHSKRKNAHRGIPREIWFAIDGHADSSVGGKYGDQGFPLSVLAEAVRKIKSPL